MQALEDHFIVALSELENTKLQHGSLELEAATFLKPLKFARCYGRVVSVPKSLSTTNKYNLSIKDHGFPTPKMGIGADWIQERNNCGDLGIDRSWYSIAGAQPQYKVMADFRWYEGMVEAGDTLYFHYHAHKPENILKQENGETWIKVRFDQAICSIPDYNDFVEIIMLTEHILVEQIGESWEDITNASGLITTVAPKTFANIAKLAHIDPETALELRTWEGSNIVIKHGSLNFEMEIEGKKYFVMKEHELAMKVVGDKAVPLGDRVLIKPDDAETKTTSGIIIPDTCIVKQHTATVLAVGSGVAEPQIQAEKRVLYAKDSGAQLEYNGEKFLVIRESDIAALIE